MASGLNLNVLQYNIRLLQLGLTKAPHSGVRFHSSRPLIGSQYLRALT